MNTLTNLIPSLYAGLDKVSRELTGFIPSVTRDAQSDRAAVGQAVTYHVTPNGNGSDIAPSMTIPEPTDQSIGNDNITITKARAYEFGFVGEERLGLDNNGAGFNPVQADMFAQAVRGLVNEVETDLSVAAFAGASRAHGTPGTIPFATNSDPASQIRKILVDNGSPKSGLKLVNDTTVGASVRTLYGINADRDFSKAPMDQQGIIATPHGLSIYETAQGSVHTAGTGESATTNADGYAMGATTITLAAAGTGSIVAGDVITFAGDSEQYVVKDGLANVTAGGDITIQEPGLRQAIDASAVAITVVKDGTQLVRGGVGFYEGAIVLASRMPALPEEGDVAADRMEMTDERSGLKVEVAKYIGYRKVRYEVALAWGVKVVQPRHTALLIS